MEFILEAPALEQCGELLIGWKQTFLIATGQKEIRRGPGIGSSRQNKRIILAALSKECWAVRCKEMGIASISFASAAKNDPQKVEPSDVSAVNATVAH